MINAITKFNIAMQTQMTAFNDRLTSLNTKMKANADDADKEIRKQIGVLEGNAQKARTSLEAARTEMEKWADDSMSTVAGWKTKVDVAMLAARADRAEHYAAAASEVAVAGVAAAEKATLDASLARKDADAAKSGNSAKAA